MSFDVKRVVKKTSIESLKIIFFVNLHLSNLKDGAKWESDDRQQARGTDP